MLFKNQPGRFEGSQSFNKLPSLEYWQSQFHLKVLLLFTSDSLQPHGLQHARLPWRSLFPRVCSSSWPLSRWYCTTTSVFPSIRVFSSESVLHIRWPKYWSFSFSISPSSEYSGWISFTMNWFHFLLSKGLWRVFSRTTIQKHQFFITQPSLWYNSHIYTWLVEKL